MTLTAPARPRTARPEITTRVRRGRVDWLLLLAVAGLLALGVVLVWSATSHRDVLTGGESQAYLKKHPEYHPLVVQG